MIGKNFVLPSKIGYVLILIILTTAMAHFSTISGFLFNENVLEKDLKICHILGQKKHPKFKAFISTFSNDQLSNQILSNRLQFSLLLF